MGFFNLKNDNVSDSVQTEDFLYVDAEKNSNLNDFLEKTKHNLKQRTKHSFWDRYWLGRSIRRAQRESKTSDEATAQAYDKEYAPGHALYGYTSIILSREGFELVTGIKSDAVGDKRILDVGAGSNEFLRFCKDELHIPPVQLHGSDISPASVRIIESDGFTGHLGRLEDLALSQRSFDLVYLSYFIDYDIDQASTFGATIDLVKSGGVVVLEGCFPVRPFALLEKDAHTFSFVTKGKNVSEDIRLVQESFSNWGKEKGRKVILKQVVETHRFVQSHYGFNRLPSHFLTFSVED